VNSGRKLTLPMWTLLGRHVAGLVHQTAVGTLRHKVSTFPHTVKINIQKRDALEFRSYRDIKMFEHSMKIFERIEVRVREKVKLDNTQVDIMGGKGTTNAICIVRQLQEKHTAHKK